MSFKFLTTLLQEKREIEEERPQGNFTLQKISLLLSHVKLLEAIYRQPLPLNLLCRLLRGQCLFYFLKM